MRDKFLQILVIIISSVLIIQLFILKAMKHPVYQNYLQGAGLDASSVAGSKAWDAEIKSIYKEARAALVSLGLAK